MIGILGVIFLGLVLWPKEKTNNFEELKPAETKPYNSEIEIPDHLKKPAMIVWETINLEIPEKLGIYRNKEGKIEENDIKKFVDLVGLDYNSKQTSDKGLILFNDKTGKYGVTVDETNKKFQYVENVFYKKELEVAGAIPTEEIQQKLITLIKSLSGGVAEINIDNIDYKEMVSPRWISTTKEKSAAVEISASYVIDQYPVKEYGGSPIVALFRNDGRLLKMEVIKGWGVNELIKEEPLVSLEELQKMGSKLFSISQVAGSKDYQLKIENEIINQLTVTEVELGYVYDATKSEFWPFYFASGNSMTTYGPVTVTVITPATKTNL